jgi:hypothetical protein
MTGPPVAWPGLAWGLFRSMTFALRRPAQFCHFGRPWRQSGSSFEVATQLSATALSQRSLANPTESTIALASRPPEIQAAPTMGEGISSIRVAGSARD